MSKFEQKEGSGALFRNDEKETESHPDYRGNIRINGQDYWLSAWIKETKATGKKYMSLAAQPKQERKVTPADAPEIPPKKGEEFDDEIPFAVAALVPVAAMLYGVLPL